MADKRGRASNAKLDNALSAFDDTKNSTLQKDQLAIKCLRESFSESLKISSASSCVETMLSHTVAISVINGRHEDTLSEVTICESIDSLKASAASALASVTIHKVATQVALELLGFDFGELNVSTPVPAPAVKATTVVPEIKELASDSDAQEPALNTQAHTEDSIHQPIVSHEGKEASTEASEPVTDDVDESENQESTDSTNATESHSQRLASILASNEESVEHQNPSEKIITPKAIAKIVNLMRDVDLSQSAIISRLRNTSASNISEMTMGESHRIANWLKKETKDSSAIISKREKFGGFDVTELNAPQDKSSKAPVEDIKTSNPAQSEANASDEAADEAQSASTKSGDAPVSQEVTRTPDTTSPDAQRAVKHYEKEVDANPERAPIIAENVLNELTNNGVVTDDIPLAIQLLTPSEMKKFRSLFAKSLFADRT